MPSAHAADSFCRFWTPNLFQDCPKLVKMFKMVQTLYTHGSNMVQDGANMFPYRPKSPRGAEWMGRGS